MLWDDFKAIPNGTKVFNHSFDECVALANLYHESVLREPFVAVGSAYQWWTLYHSIPALYNTYTQSRTPIAGAVVVSRYGIYNAPNGHIEVVTSVNSDGSFNTMGQNASGHRYVWRYRRTMQNILGFLHPHNNPAGNSNRPTRLEADMAVIIRTDKGDILVVDHNQMTYWNVHEGIPAKDVPARIDWLKAQGMTELHGLQPAAMLRGYAWAHAGSGPQADTDAIAERVSAKVLAALGDGVKIDSDELAASIAREVNDDVAKRMKS